MSDPGFSIDGVDLQDPAGRWELARATKRRGIPAVRATSVTTPGRHGSHFLPNERFEPGSMSVVLNVYDKDSTGVSQGPAQAEANLELLTSLFTNTGRLLEIEHRQSQYIKRVAMGRVTAGSMPEAVGFELTWYQLTFVIEVPKVFWSDGAGPQVISGAAPTASGAIFLPTLNGGSAPIADAIVRLQGPFNGNATVTDPVSGTGLSWQGTLAAGRYLFLNADSLKAWTSTSATAWTTGTDVTSGLDYPYAGPLQLTPTVTAAGTTYALDYDLPAANTAVTAVAVRAERKFL